MTMELFKNDKARIARAMCLWTVSLSCLPHECDNHNLTYVFSKVSFRIGQIIGQPLGGLLSHPARTMPFFNSPFWREYPFALPCFAASAFAFFATILAVLALPEVPLCVNPFAGPANAILQTLQKKNDNRLTPISEEPDTPQSSLKATLALLDTNSILILASLFTVAFTSEMPFVM